MIVARVRLVPVALAAVLAGCDGGTAPADVAPVDAAADAPPDAPLADAAPPPDAARANTCPAPTPVRVADVPRGYLRPEPAGLVRAIDGDTAVFRFASGSQTVRFLFVNTEESSGAEITPFGVMSAEVVRGYLGAARELTVVVRESPRTPGTPNLDPYGRWLALVFVDGELLQSRIVREGLSPYYTQFGCATDPVHTNLLRAEAEANAAARGVWAPGHPRDYAEVLPQWIGSSRCRPNPFIQPYCP